MITHRKETRGLGGIFFDDLNDRCVLRLHAVDCMIMSCNTTAPVVQY